jgi:putative PIN family toxin of toxin-antitoxin system
MRVVVDTNIFVSAALRSGSLPALAIRLVHTRHVLLKSRSTEHELVSVLARPKFLGLIAPAFNDFVAATMVAAEPVEIKERITACRDARDDKFLELAVNGNADFLVSGDNDLLVLNPFRAIPIVSAWHFVQQG